ncbi:PREDICTED: probably inactive leucine-rich repeat receptor-like protein kinase At5g48380 [Camelina sativa]|uniref:Probably inactive leucine-rich repeat receptor-like protein kinase At5g48380 n=1 Tax=Camelina sativa TaxID=90675 RepID=A0ABM0Y0K2_CAMSA|nr:PREDICTED: probably inactive leucine-rich repeat receptor-like protein kinase At5g48380 [Camelina sativa]XP_010493654.1 PREDICTED: probably inactive leucine-rich repeat receptor-like protein kinase At5g48380 [Camelina sativa]
MMVCKVFAIFFGNSLCLLLLLSSLADANQANIDCLKTFKSQVEDPNGYLSSWEFGNQTAQGFICKFSGVTCWHDDEDRVFSIMLSGYGLGGVFPQGIKLCSDLTHLDLSRNNFSGPLPSYISLYSPVITTLDLSYNSFSGEIPMLISNITFLNTLQLHHNQFTGTLPPQLGQLRRLNTFSVADNRLEGPIPKFNSASITSESFANNLNLCGKPLVSG